MPSAGVPLPHSAAILILTLLGQRRPALTGREARAAREASSADKHAPSATQFQTAAWACRNHDQGVQTLTSTRGLALTCCIYRCVQGVISELARSRSSRFSCAGAMMTGEERGLLSLDPFLRPAPSRFPPRAMSLNLLCLIFFDCSGFPEGKCSQPHEAIRAAGFAPFFPSAAFLG